MIKINLKEHTSLLNQYQDIISKYIFEDDNKFWHGVFEGIIRKCGKNAPKCTNEELGLPKCHSCLKKVFRDDVYSSFIKEYNLKFSYKDKDWNLHKEKAEIIKIIDNIYTKYAKSSHCKIICEYIKWYKKSVNDYLPKIFRKDEIEKYYNEIFHIIKLTYKGFDFIDFTTMEFSELKNIRNKLVRSKSTVLHNLMYISYKKTENNMQPICKRILLLYEELINIKFNTIMVKELNIKACPYCNREYIDNRGEYATAQLDHFYPKSIYPILAVCIYNLVPVGSACNHIKRDKDKDKLLSPYCDNNSIFKKQVFKLNIQSLDKLIALKPKQMQIELDKKNSYIKDTLECMKISEAYQLDGDYVKTIINKAYIYNESRIDDLRKNFPKLFLSSEEILETLYGQPLTHDDFYKQPLSKLTSDILRDINVIDNNYKFIRKTK